MTGGLTNPNSDETFIVLEGTLAIEFFDGFVELQAGHLMVVERGTIHRARPVGGRSVNLTVERKDTITVKVDDPFGHSGTVD